MMVHDGDCLDPQYTITPRHPQAGGLNSPAPATRAGQRPYITIHATLNRMALASRQRSCRVALVSKSGRAGERESRRLPGRCVALASRQCLEDYWAIL